jgi:hypothetical protein
VIAPNRLRRVAARTRSWLIGGAVGLVAVVVGISLIGVAARSGENRSSITPVESPNGLGVAATATAETQVIGVSTVAAIATAMGAPRAALPAAAFPTFQPLAAVPADAAQVTNANVRDSVAAIATAMLAPPATLAPAARATVRSLAAGQAQRVRATPTPAPPSSSVAIIGDLTDSVGPIATLVVERPTVVVMPTAQPAVAAQPTLVVTPTAEPTIAAQPTDVVTPTAEPTTRLEVTNPDVADNAQSPGTPEPPEASDSERWDALQPQLDAAWGADTAATIALLKDFVDRFPDFAPAREKLYAALIAQATDLGASGDRDGATEAAQRAASLLPDRGEAMLLLASLEPRSLADEVAPAPVDQVAAAGAPAAETGQQPARVSLPPPRTPTPRPVLRTQPPVQAQPAPRQAPVQPRPAIPTKVPFVPPGGN